MPFIPHTKDEIKKMLETIGEDSILSLFDEIPKDLLFEALNDIPQGLSEMNMAREIKARAAANNNGLCFIGAGAYEHHIPAAVWDIASRGEFLTAYTPYQAEASQGSLQLIYEYQTMMARLMGLEVSNASLYEGASALAEAVLMAVRCHKKSKARRILVAGTVPKVYRDVVTTITHQQKIELIELPFCPKRGVVMTEALDAHAGTDITALVIPQPNVFGCLESVDVLTDWAHAQGALVIGCVNPMLTALLKAPGQWGAQGADIACGEGQPLGIPLNSGGPYFGFLCCRQALVRQLPGRLVGRTEDLDGKPGFTLTLQAREQHIRRSKATSNICTNQGLMVTAATIYMSLLGGEGLRRVAAASHQNSVRLKEKLTAIDGVETVFDSAIGHEFAIRLPAPVATVLADCADLGIQGGYNLTGDYPELGECLLVCATETKTEADLDRYVDALKKNLGAARSKVSSSELVES